MTIRTLTKFRNPDITSDINNRLSDLIKKGIFLGGQITPIAGSLEIDVQSFGVMGADGMVTLLEGSPERLTVVASGENNYQYIVLHTEYKANDNPVVEFEVLTEVVFDALTSAQRTARIVFARLDPSVGAADVQISDIDYTVADIIDQQNRFFIRGVVEALVDLPDYTDPPTGVTTINRHRDVWFVKETLLFHMWDGTLGTPQWIEVISSAALIRLDEHKDNQDDGALAPDFFEAQHVKVPFRESHDEGSASVKTLASGGNAFGAGNAIVDEKYSIAIMARAEFSPTVQVKVQLIGQVFTGVGATGTADQYLRLAASGAQTPLVGTDGRPITVLKINTSDDLGELDPSSDALPLGFYTDPYVYLDFTATADADISAPFSIIYSKHKYLGQLTPQEMIEHNFFDPSALYPGKSGASSLVDPVYTAPPNPVNGALDFLLQEINKRVAKGGDTIIETNIDAVGLTVTGGDGSSDGSDGIKGTGGESSGLFARGGIGVKGIGGAIAHFSGYGGNGLQGEGADSIDQNAGVGVYGVGGDAVGFGANGYGGYFLGGGTNATGVYGKAVGTEPGVRGLGGSAGSYGVQGEGIGNGYGVYGVGGVSGSGVVGLGKTIGIGVSGTGGNTDGSVGVYGTSQAINGIGVEGLATGTEYGVKGTGGGANGSIGVYGTSSAPNGRGVEGLGTGTEFGVKGTGGDTDDSIGVYGTSGATNGRGVEGLGTGTGYGVKGEGGGNNGAGVLGFGIGIGRGVEGKGGSNSGIGVYGIGGSPDGWGMYAQGVGDGVGVFGQGGSGGNGVEGKGGSSNGTGVEGTGGGSGGIGVLGKLLTGAEGPGVVGYGSSGSGAPLTDKIGVFGGGGLAIASVGHTGVKGVGSDGVGSGNDGGHGVHGIGGSRATTGLDGDGVRGESARGSGVHGISTDLGWAFLGEGPGAGGIRITNTGGLQGAWITTSSSSSCIYAEATGTGYGATIEAAVTTPTRSALRIVPQDTDPPSSFNGDIYVNSGTTQIRFRDGSDWADFITAHSKSVILYIPSTSFVGAEDDNSHNSAHLKVLGNAGNYVWATIPLPSPCTVTEVVLAVNLDNGGTGTFSLKLFLRDTWNSIPGMVGTATATAGDGFNTLITYAPDISVGFDDVLTIGAQNSTSALAEVKGAKVTFTRTYPIGAGPRYSM